MKCVLPQLLPSKSIKQHEEALAQEVVQNVSSLFSYPRSENSFWGFTWSYVSKPLINHTALDICGAKLFLTTLGMALFKPHWEDPCRLGIDLQLAL